MQYPFRKNNNKSADSAEGTKGFDIGLYKHRKKIDRQHYKAGVMEIPRKYMTMPLLSWALKQGLTTLTEKAA